MAISVVRKNDDNTIVILVDGRFDFSLHALFRSAYKDEVLNNGVFVVDLLNTKYLDSSALGMLLLLKEHAENMGSSVVISNSNKEIIEILHVASFDKLFKIES